MMPPTIVDLTESDTDLIEQIVVFLPDCFREFSPAWLTDTGVAREEVTESLAVERRSRVLIDEERNALGWIGAIPDENVWEIHPIAVAPAAQGKGYGTLLVDDIVGLARTAGAVAVWAGTSDETGATSLSNADLYGDAAAAMQILTADPRHPVHFWRKMGFSLVGVMPDAEGLGKPGITFARRIV